MEAKQYVQQRLKVFAVNAIIFIALLSTAIFFLGMPKYLILANALLLTGYLTIEIIEYRAWKSR